MKLNNKTYDIIKWVVMIVLPALSALYVGLAVRRAGGGDYLLHHRVPWRAAGHFQCQL